MCSEEKVLEASEPNLTGFDINLLSPAELLVIKIELEGVQRRVLIDSGASNSLIKDEVISDPSTIEKRSRVTEILGLGNSRVAVCGEVKSSIKVWGRWFEVDGIVVGGSSIEYDIILGIDFLRKYGFTICMSSRKLSFNCDDGSRVKVELSTDNELVDEWVERVPVLSVNDVRLDNEVKLITGDMSALSEYHGMFWFEGVNKNVVTLDGVFDPQAGGIKIFGKTGQSGKGVTVKKNEVIGYAYSMVVTEDEIEDTSSWTSERLREEVKLGDQLDNEQKDKVWTMLMELKEALSEGENDIGAAKVEPHRIELTNETPIWQKARSFSQPINEEINRQCQDLLVNDIIEYSDSNWSSPIVPVRKGDGSLRLCVDYRQVNKVTCTEKFPMPNLSKCIYRASNVKYFTKLDLIRGYYQVPIEPQSREYTAFSTCENHFQFKRLSFGLKNSGIAFQKLMQQILSPVMCSNVIVYIDDILIMSQSYEEHLTMVKKVLNLLRQYGIKIKVTKCEWFVDSVTFLGHVVSREGIRKSEDFTRKVRNIERPVTIKQMRQFLGLINFQRKFVKNCSLLTKPFSELITGPNGKKVIWTEELDRKFEELKVTKD